MITEPLALGSSSATNGGGEARHWWQFHFPGLSLPTDDVCIACATTRRRNARVKSTSHSCGSHHVSITFHCCSRIERIRLCTQSLFSYHNRSQNVIGSCSNIVGSFGNGARAHRVPGTSGKRVCFPSGRLHVSPNNEFVLCFHSGLLLLTFSLPGVAE